MIPIDHPHFAELEPVARYVRLDEWRLLAYGRRDEVVRRVILRINRVALYNAALFAAQFTVMIAMLERNLDVPWAPGALVGGGFLGAALGSAIARWVTGPAMRGVAYMHTITPENVAA